MPAWATGRRGWPRRRFHLSRATLALALGGLASLALFAVLPEAPFTLDGQPLVGPVERFADGDTIEIAGQRIRLVGLDAPEWDQTCTGPDGATWPCGRVASERLRELAHDAVLTCRPEGHDRYRRLLAVCRTGQADLGEVLVRDGLAIADGRYMAAEQEARNAGRGLWQGAFLTPAAWRAGEGRTEPGSVGNPSRVERILGWLSELLAS